MKRKTDNLKAIALVILLILLLKLIPVLPWWGFLLPVIALAALIRRLQWRVAFFPVGLVAGCIIWVMGNLLWDSLLRGHILSCFGSTVKILLLLVAGLMGGILTGLAMLTGKYLTPLPETVPGKE